MKQRLLKIILSKNFKKKVLNELKLTDTGIEGAKRILEFIKIKKKVKNIKTLINIQCRLRKKVILIPPDNFSPKLIAGVDVAYSRKDEYLYGAVVILTLPELNIIEKKIAIGKVKFPYIPGFLSFREVPILLKVFKQIKQKPHVILVDGQGIAHPRRFGLACHLGICLNIPTIGCAKSCLIGTYNPVPNQLGSYSFLKDNEEIIGLVLRTRKGVKPIFVSPGHLIDIETTYNITLASLKGYRIPEPIRLAHIEANIAKASLNLD